VIGDAALAGRVARLWRYPVKSMLGERAATLALDNEGVRGDRRYVARDAHGRPNSGKSLSGHGRIEGLLDLSAGIGDDGPEIRFPDGIRRGLDDPDLEAALTATLGQPVTLRDEGGTAGAHVDSSPVHLLTTASLAWLCATLPDATVDERRFRPNIVVDWPDDQPVEQDWIGCRLRVGEIELRITEPTVRCGMVSMAHAELPRDPSVLRHITKQADLNFGVYAQVITPGCIAENDRVDVVG